MAKQKTDEPEKPSVSEEEKKRALSDYEEHLNEVLRAKEMTDTAAWQEFYRRLQQDIKRHGEDVLDAEKPREVVHHQEGVKLLRALIQRVADPVGKLDGFIQGMPLFAHQFKTRATWNQALGKVELHEIE